MPAWQAGFRTITQHPARLTPFFFSLLPTDVSAPFTPDHYRVHNRYVHNFIKYEFDFRFDVPATYPAVAPEIELPELEGKTAKMYRGGKICLTIHFKPLWAKNRCVTGSSCATHLQGRGCWDQDRGARQVQLCELLLTALLLLFRRCRCCCFAPCSPHFGFAHALCLGLAPWLAAEVPYMVEAGVISPKV